MNSKCVKELIAAARARNVAMADTDRRAGLAAPDECPLDEQLATVLAALEAALAVKDWFLVADAYALCEAALKQSRTEAKATVSGDVA